MRKGTLIFFCGKMGAGKSTKAAEIALRRNAVLLSEDDWLEALYPKTITTLEDYIEYSTRLKLQIKKLVQSILGTGADVVMDFPANTIGGRVWFRSIFSEVDAPHELIFLDVPNALCLERIRKRRQEQPERAATDTPELFEQVTKYFVPPTAEEGFNTLRVSSDS